MPAHAGRGSVVRARPERRIGGSGGIRTAPYDHEERSGHEFTGAGFPGPVTDTDGKADGDTVSWTLESFTTTTMTAEAATTAAGTGLGRPVWGLPLWAWLVIGVVAVAALIGLLIWAVRRGGGGSDRPSSRQTDAGLPILGGDWSDRSGEYAAPGYAAPPGHPWAAPEGPPGQRPAWEVPQDLPPHAPPPPAQTPAGPPPTSPPGFVAAPGPNVEPDSRLAGPGEFAGPDERPAAEQPRRSWFPASDATQAVSTFAKPPPPPPVVEPEQVPPVPPAQSAPPTAEDVAELAEPAQRAEPAERAVPAGPAPGGWPPPSPIWEDEPR